MRGIIIVLMAILGVIFPKFLVKAIKSTDKNDAGGGHPSAPPWSGRAC